MTAPLEVVVLAAGQGTRMRSALPKVLHRLAGRALLEHVYHAARALPGARVHIVYGHGGEAVPRALAHLDARWVEQREQLGTGHAVAQALPGIADTGTVLVLYGDVPLIRATTLQRLLDGCGDGGLALLTARLDDPSGYGRILRDVDGRVQRIVEERDAQAAERAVQEVNTGILAAPAAWLRAWVGRLGRANAQGEYYLTDVVAMAVADGVPVQGLCVDDAGEVLGVNDRVQLAGLERALQRREAERLMRSGVTLLDPARFDVRGEVQAGSDVVIDVNVVLEGRVIIGDGVSIGPNVYLRDVELGDGAVVLANCVIEEARVGRRARIGPFSRVRPQTVLGEQVHVGNFVELKNAAVAERSKINHLAYIGDTEIGRDTNVGAGTITCNYDGANKHRTVIGDDVFIGSDVQLVAPVQVGDGATIGAGTTLTEDAPPGKLTLGRARQVTVEHWTRPRKDHAQ